MKQAKYDSNFIVAFLDPSDMIQHWVIDKNSIQSWLNLKDAPMIFVPKINDHASHEKFFCSICKKWLSITNSVKNIKRHVIIHDKNFNYTPNRLKKNDFFSNSQEQMIIEKIVNFIIFNTQTFQYTENSFLRSLSQKLPDRNKITKILSKIANLTIQEIKSNIIYSSSNSITFDQWTSNANIPYLGITIRCLIESEYKDYFLGLIEITSENLSADNLAIEVSKALETYNLSTENIVSCTTDNCQTMINTSDALNILRFPCVCHILNLIFQVFVENSKINLNPFFDLVNYLTRSSKYSLYVINQKIKKIPSYTEVRWTSFCTTILYLLENKQNIKQFCLANQKNFPSEKDWINLSLLKNLCKQYIEIITFFEADHFGASGYFLLYIDILQDKFFELKNTVFKDAAKCARNKINELQHKHSIFWNNIAPIALLLTPSIPYTKLLSTSEISTAKSRIIKRMEKYTINNNNNINNASNDGPEILKKYRQDSNPNSPKKNALDKILEDRNLDFDIEVLKNFWFNKIDTNEKSLALVAIDVLGAVITSVASERSFSRGRLIINEQRTRISSEHANHQMIIQLNPNEAKKAISRSDIFN